MNRFRRAPQSCMVREVLRGFMSSAASDFSNLPPRRFLPGAQTHVGLTGIHAVVDDVSLSLSVDAQRSL